MSVIWKTTTTAFEQAEVSAEIADELEVRRKTRVLQHAPGITAYREHPTGFDTVMLVEHKRVRCAGNAAAIDHRLTVVLTGRFKSIELEQPVGGRVEACITEFSASAESVMLMG